MAGQNIYDDPDFLSGYATLDRQVRGLAGAAEWPILRSMLPDISGRRILDLGCGFGWFSRWAVVNGAAAVEAVDVSTAMLDRARSDARTELIGEAIEFRCVDLDEFDGVREPVDLVFSSLAFHYVDDVQRLLRAVSASLAPGGALVFSVEHPIYSAPSKQTFVSTADGDRVWPLDNYLAEGERVRHWYVDGVVKQHRTVATYVNAVIDAGLALTRIDEFGTTEDLPDGEPTAPDGRHRPWFLLVSAVRPA